MRKLLLLAAVAALAGCSKDPAPAQTDEANATAAATDANAVTPAAVTLHETTWTFTDKDGKAIEESIDAAGNYIATAGAAHDDHGTYVAKDGKACFTSAMNQDGEMCWTVQDVPVGGSFETVNDKGE